MSSTESVDSTFRYPDKIPSKKKLPLVLCSQPVKHLPHHRLHVRPVIWRSCDKKAIPCIHDRSLKQSNIVEMCGYTADRQTIYLRIQVQATYQLQWNHTIDDDLIATVIEAMDGVTDYPDICSTSGKEIVVRAPKYHDLDELSRVLGTSKISCDESGSLSGLWQARSLQPYQWITIEHYSPLPGKYAAYDFNVIVDECELSAVHLPIDISPLPLFWNLDTNTGEIITCDLLDNKEHHLTTGDISDGTHKVHSEEYLLHQTLNYFRRADRIIYCEQGSSMVRFIERCEINNIDGNTEDVKFYDFIDLRRYYRRCYPYLTDCELLTLTSCLTHVKDDASNLRRLQGLWCRENSHGNNVEEHLEFVANNLRVDIGTLLYMNYSELVDRVICNIRCSPLKKFSPTESVSNIDIQSPNHLARSKRGCYPKVYRYDYSELYRHVLFRTTQSRMLTILGERLVQAPPELIYHAFFSRHNTEDNVQVFEKLLDEILAPHRIVSVSEYVVCSTTLISSPMLTYIGCDDRYLSLGSSSVTLRQGKLFTQGIAPICRPPCLLTRKLLTECLQNYPGRSSELDAGEYTADVLRNKFPNREDEITNLTMTTTLGTNLGKIDNVKYQLARHVDYEPDIRIVVDYVWTLAGPLPISKISPTTVLDYEQYSRIITTYRDHLKILFTTI